METVFSPDRQYRYTLWRRWGDITNFVMFIGLNPSIADEFRDDPTIRKCRGFAKRWGYDAMCMTNLFAFRATDPRQLKNVNINPIGLGNDYYLLETARKAKLIVAAWGKHGRFLKQDYRVEDSLRGFEIMCFKKNKDGSPAHPLYIPYETPLIEYKTR